MTIRKLNDGSFIVHYPCDLRMINERKNFVKVDGMGRPKNPEEVPIIVKLGRAYRMSELMLSGTYKSRQEVADALGVSVSLVSRILNCAFVSPVIVEKVLHGEISAAKVMNLVEKVHTLPFWSDQHRFLGIE